MNQMTLMNMDFAAIEQKAMAHFMSLKKINGVDMMSHLQIAQVVNSRPDNVKRTMERLALLQGLIHVTPMEEDTGYNNQKREVYYVNERDSHVVVARISPQYTANLVDFWMNHRNAVPAFSVPKSYSEALLLAGKLAEENEEKQRLLVLKEERITEQQRIKAHITEGREGTLFAKVGHLTQENNKLKDELGEGKKWKAARAVEWLPEFFKLKGKGSQGTWVAIGHALRILSFTLNMEIRQMQDAAYVKVNKYHVDVIDAFREQLVWNPRYMEKYRRDNGKINRV